MAAHALGIRGTCLSWLLHLAAPALLAAWTPPLHALTLRLCVEETAHQPYITPDGHGETGELIREAARLVGINVVFRAVPLLRCREEVRSNRVDGYPMAPYTPSLMSFVAYPMQDGEADPTHAVAIWRMVVYRRMGSRVEWDGRRFRQLTTPVLIPSGATFLMDRLAALDVPMEHGSKTAEMNFMKLLAGRADMAIEVETKGEVLMRQERFRNGIEALQPAFAEVPVYLGLSRQFYESNTRAADRLWHEIARLRKAAQEMPRQAWRLRPPVCRIRPYISPQHCSYTQSPSRDFRTVNPENL